MGGFEDIVSTSVSYETAVSFSLFDFQQCISLMHKKKGPRKVSPMFVPRILINMVAGHLTMKYGFQVRCQIQKLYRTRSSHKRKPTAGSKPRSFHCLHNWSSLDRRCHEVHQIRRRRRDDCRWHRSLHSSTCNCRVCKVCMFCERVDTSALD